MSQNPEDVKTTDELKKLATIASDLDLASKMRTQAIELLGDMASHEALLVLLNRAANEKLNIDERDLAIKQAREIIKKGR